jgi:hypothetical protein
MKMNARGTLVLLALVLAASPVRAQVPAAAPSDLTVVVVESLDQRPGRVARFDRIAEVFGQVFARRKWPIHVHFERFAANTSDSETQLRIFYQGIYSETPGDLVFHAWMLLYVNGVKHDFGVVRYRYYPRPGQMVDINLDRIVEGAANEAAARIEPILFPADKPAR